MPLWPEMRSGSFEWIDLERESQTKLKWRVTVTWQRMPPNIPAKGYLEISSLSETYIVEYSSLQWALIEYWLSSYREERDVVWSLHDECRVTICTVHIVSMQRLGCSRNNKLSGETVREWQNDIPQRCKIVSSFSSEGKFVVVITKCQVTNNSYNTSTSQSSALRGFLLCFLWLIVSWA